MAVRIVLSRAGAVSVRIGAPTRSIDVDLRSIDGTVLVVATGSGDLSVRIRSRGRGARGRSVPASDDIGLDPVSPAMEAAAVRAFLGAADVGRLGASLSAVYLAMEEVRRLQAEGGGVDDP